MKTLPQNFFIKNDGSEKFKQYIQWAKDVHRTTFTGTTVGHYYGVYQGNFNHFNEIDGLRDYTILTLDEFFESSKFILNKLPKSFVIKNVRVNGNRFQEYLGWLNKNFGTTYSGLLFAYYGVNEGKPISTDSPSINYPKAVVLTLDEFFDIIEPKKELPESFVILHDESPDFCKFIEWMNTTYDICYAGDCKNTYYGFLNGTPYWYGPTHPKTIILTLDEFFSIINPKTQMENTQTVLKKDFKRLHDIACATWQPKLVKYTQRDPWSDSITFREDEVLSMWKACTTEQKKEFLTMFKEPVEDKYLRFKDDGSMLKDEDGRIITITRSEGNYKGKSIYLDDTFDWSIVIDDLGKQCLVAKRK